MNISNVLAFGKFVLLPTKQIIDVVVGVPWTGQEIPSIFMLVFVGSSSNPVPVIVIL
jgi:hypothetical protein